MKEGYHYTSVECWEQIRAEGLQPYPITIPDIGWRGNGIWIWPKLPVGKEHAGNLILQLARKGTPYVVRLGVQYEDAEVLVVRGKPVALSHWGTVEKWNYHWWEPALILSSERRLNQVRLVDEWDIIALLNREPVARTWPLRPQSSLAEMEALCQPC